METTRHLKQVIKMQDEIIARQAETVAILEETVHIRDLLLRQVFMSFHSGIPVEELDKVAERLQASKDPNDDGGYL